MPGNIIGGKKTAEKLKKEHGEDFYKIIGKLGGLKSTGGGFAYSKKGKDGLTGPERARIAGAKGGKRKRLPL